jgi:hypothetical protein
MRVSWFGESLYHNILLYGAEVLLDREYSSLVTANQQRVPYLQ